MANKVITEICNFYGVSSLMELLESEQEQLMDSLQDGFCRKCGAYYGQVEPDAQNYTCEECNENSVSSLTMLFLF